MRWTMTCPQCRQTISKEDAEDIWNCPQCGWDAESDVHPVQLTDLYECA